MPAADGRPGLIAGCLQKLKAQTEFATGYWELRTAEQSGFVLSTSNP
jgi:hypothetical protein